MDLSGGIDGFPQKWPNLDSLILVSGSFRNSLNPDNRLWIAKVNQHMHTQGVKSIIHHLLQRLPRIANKRHGTLAAVKPPEDGI